MDSSVSPKDEIWFLRFCHHVSNAVCFRQTVLYVIACGVSSSKPGVATEVALERSTGHWEDFCVRANVRTFKRRIYFCKNIPWIMLVTWTIRHISLRPLFSATKTSLLTLNLLTTTIVAPPSNVSKWQMGFNSVFKGLMLSGNVALLSRGVYTELNNTLCG